MIITARTTVKRHWRCRFAIFRRIGREGDTDVYAVLQFYYWRYTDDLGGSWEETLDPTNGKKYSWHYDDSY